MLLIVTVSLFANQVEKIKMYTEHYPPYNMKDINGNLKGTSIKVLEAMLIEMKSNQTINDVKLRSWSKSYSVAQRIKNAMVFSTTRTKSREKDFKWVGPIRETTIGVIALKERNLKINKTSDLSQYNIGAVLKDVGETLLLEAGVDKKNIQYVKGEDAINLSLKKIDKNRIDMFVYETNVAFSHIKTENYDMDKYEVIFTLKKGFLYFAFNKNTDDKIINKWQNALDTVKKNGLLDKINKN